MSEFGYINSIQSLGTLDGPGIRFVVFTQGCNLRCGCCHNPDTWKLNEGTIITSEELIEKAVRYKSYFGSEGGVTVSGGEPLLQPEFISDFFKLCHKNNINTCLDTSGCILNSNIKEMLNHTDRVLLDIKYTSDEYYRKYVGCSLDAPLTFLNYLSSIDIPVVIRQVIIPSLNDSVENINKLKELVNEYKNIERVELLPFKKICNVKYENMGIEFPFKNFSVPDKDSMDRLNSLLVQ